MSLFAHPCGLLVDPIAGLFDSPEREICQLPQLSGQPGGTEFHLLPETVKADALLIAAAPALLSEMRRYLPLLEYLESMPAWWGLCTAGTGIATLNAYRAAIAKASGASA